MNFKYIHIIYAVDETTNFLREIISYLSQYIDSRITIHEIGNLKQELNFKANIATLIPINSVVLFMGHGTSSSLRGPSVLSNSFGPLFNETELSLLKDRKVILLSCRSNEYLKKFARECGLKAGLGFPNLITDQYETLYPEEPDRVNGVLHEDIEKFKDVLVDIVKFALEEFIVENFSFFELYKRIKLRVQKELIKYYFLNSNNGKTPYGKMLYDLNTGINIIGN